MSPGRPFWTGFTAFATNMVALFGVDQLSVFEAGVSVNNWLIAAMISMLVAAAVYGHEKVSDMKAQEPLPERSDGA